MTAKSAAEKFKFRSFSADAQDVLGDTAINTVFIATRHNSHGELVLKALEADKNVYVEKPLTIEETDLGLIAEAIRRHPTRRLQVGFNRRFAPLAVQARELFRGVPEPLVLNYRVSAGFIPRDHWTQTGEGGGRILGEVCHFIDFLQFMTGSEPVRVFAECVANLNAKAKNQDNVAITIAFRNGSVGLITYLACGDRLLAKERIEIFGGEKSFIINDFRTADVYFGGKLKKVKGLGKGHKEEIEQFIASIREGRPSPIPLESLLLTTVTAFRVLDALRTGLPQGVEIPE
jgi:polar amino acid transport system substrate-binding protein